MKTNKFLLSPKWLIPSILFIFIGIPSAIPQSRRVALFQETEKIYLEAKESQASLYSPRNFLEGEKYLQEADKDFKSGKNQEDIMKKLTKARDSFNAAIETTKMAMINFQDLISARNDALAAEAPAYRQEQWEKAESGLDDATKTLEGGNLKGSKDKAKKAEELYRAVELEAIKANYLDETRTIIKQGQKGNMKKNASLTLAKAQDLADRAEILLNESRYDTDEARQIAQEAKYEAQHAMFITETVEHIKDSDKSLESILLENEEPIRKIGDELDMNVLFQEGFNKPTSAVIKRIAEQKRAIATLKQDLNDKNEQISALSTQISSMESQLGDLKSKEATLSMIMEQQRVWREKAAKVEKMFTPDEAQVHRTGDNVTMRLYGLNFASGKASIESNYFGLLSKVQKAIDEYPDCGITIEGHTDSFGGDQFNHTLSTKRAEAVREYFLATAGIAAERVVSVGYGETKPIASNETKEGRRKNRRIDVVLHPKK